MGTLGSRDGGYAVESVERRAPEALSAEGRRHRTRGDDTRLSSSLPASHPVGVPRFGWSSHGGHQRSMCSCPRGLALP